MKRKTDEPVGIPSGWEYLAAFYWDADLWPTTRQQLLLHHLGCCGGIYRMAFCDFTETPDV